jgi:hypothetical protein
MTETAFQRCDWEDCRLLAVGYVKAQWTIADFVRFEGCDAHLWDMRAALDHTLVEGFAPELAIGWYE